MKTFPHFKQLDQMDCGPTCLQMVCKYYGRDFTLAQLRGRSSITREGVSLLGINDAAQSIGFRTLGIETSFKKLEEEVPLPCIAHWRQYHFIVLYNIEKGKVYVADPAVGHITYSVSEFLKGWVAPKTDGESTGMVLVLEPAPLFYSTAADVGNKKKTISNIFNYLKSQQSLLIRVILILLLGNIMQLVLPFMTQSVVDVGINKKDIHFIYLLLLGQLMLFVGRTTLEFTRRWLLLHLSTRINIAMISDFLKKLYKLPIHFFESKMIGDILRRIDDHTRIERFLSNSSINIMFSFLSLLVFGIVLAFYHLAIFFTFFCLSILYGAYLLLFMKRRAELDYKKFQELSVNQSGLIQTIQGMTEIKINNCETLKQWEWERIQTKIYKLTLYSTKLQLFQDGGSGFINELKNLLITTMAALAVVNGEMTMGMMLAVQYIIGQLNVPVNDFVNFTREWQDAKISLERVSEIHEQENEGDNEEQGTTEQLPKKEIVIRGLSFQYDGPRSPKVLDNINLNIPEGKVTAIVGTSGSGKTTLLKLLLKLYKPTEGNIYLGETDLARINTRIWRNECGTVMQDGFIFSDNISRNIALSEETADLTRLDRALKVANIDEFVENLPLGANTNIGSNGIGLSQGQKQRLLIARAVYKNPSFLFFDEATSSLDATNEKMIIGNLTDFLKEKTVIVIAHRLSTVKNADQIVVMEYGKVVEVGTHKTLTASRGKYYELVKNQLELGN